MSYQPTIEEKYRRLCMKLVAARFAYYVQCDPLYEDFEYDRLEDGLKKIEAALPHLIHPKSPTKVPGSDNRLDYPQSVIYFCEHIRYDKDGPRELPYAMRERAPSEPSLWDSQRVDPAVPLPQQAPGVAVAGDVPLVEPVQA